MILGSGRRMVASMGFRKGVGMKGRKGPNGKVGGGILPLWTAE